VDLALRTFNINYQPTSDNQRDTNMRAGNVQPNKRGALPGQVGRAAGGVDPRRFARTIPDLRPGEAVVALLHRHPLTLLSAFAPVTLVLALWAASALVVVPFLQSLRVDPLLSTNPPPSWVAPVLWSAWLGFAFLLLCRFAYVLLDWRQDWMALTTRRLIIMNKSLFVREERRECPIGKVQNVIAEFPNPIGMAFDFGDLSVDTAGAGTLTFKDLPHPALIREAIFKQQEILRSKQPAAEDLRRAALRSIVLEQDPLDEVSTQDGSGSGLDDSIGEPRTGAAPVSGYGLFHSFFPIAPQRDGARVTWRKHWSCLVRGLIRPMAVYLLIFAAWLLVPTAILHDPAGPAGRTLSWFVLAAFPFCAGWTIWNWEDWRSDLYKLDHERVYHIESLPFGLREQSMETLIGRVSDVMYVVPGPLANLLNYGDVIIQTPGEATQFKFKSIGCPREVQQEIMERVDQYRRKNATGTDREIEAWIRAYHDVIRGA